MKSGLRVLQFMFAVAIVAVVGYVVYAFESSFGFVVFVFGLMCFGVLFTVAGLIWNKKVSLGVKLGVLSLGVILVVVGIVIMYWGL